MATESQDDTFSHSLTDLMASVAVLFLLIAAIFMVRSLKQSREAENKLQAAFQERETALQALQRVAEEIRHDSAIKDVEVQIPDDDPTLMIVSISERVFGFVPGGCEPNESGRKTVAVLGRKIVERVCSLDATKLVQQITLEGHTDKSLFLPSHAKCGADPVPAELGCTAKNPSDACADLGFRGNVRLSAARAQSIYDLLRKELSASRSAATECLNHHFVVSGRGPADPLVNEAEVGGDDPGQKNRRVVIKVRVKADLKELGVAGTR